MRAAPGASASQLRGRAGPPSQISKRPSGDTSKWPSLSTPQVLLAKRPSAAPASTVSET